MLTAVTFTQISCGRSCGETIEVLYQKEKNRLGAPRLNRSSSWFADLSIGKLARISPPERLGNFDFLADVLRETSGRKRLAIEVSDLDADDFA